MWGIGGARLTFKFEEWRESVLMYDLRSVAICERGWGVHHKFSRAIAKGSATQLNLRERSPPVELGTMCVNNGLNVIESHGSSPVVSSKAFFRRLETGVVSLDFRFKNTSSTLLGYTRFAVRR